MRWQALLTIASTILASSAAAQAQEAEIGYPEGSLAYQAITSANYAAAEARLRKETRVNRDDPALLLNYGHVLAKTGRPADAARMFERAAAADEIELILADGRVINSREAARRALQRVSVGGPEDQER